MNSILIEAGKLQDGYDELLKSGSFTKKALCDLCIPFRDKYKLTDIQTLQIARRKMSITRISELEGSGEDE